ILAKTARDAHMAALDAQFPGYGFAKHKGYPVRAHVGALERLGACPIHRRSLAPVRIVLGLPPLSPWHAPPHVGCRLPADTVPPRRSCSGSSSESGVGGAVSVDGRA